MKQKFFSLAVLLLAVMMVFGLSSQSNADVTDSGPGSAMLFTYYDVRSVADGGLGLTDNYFTVINTSTHWIQSHVRVRTGDCSVELLDFDVLQSPKDVFVFDLYQDGGITFASCDTNTLLDSNFTLNFDADGDGTDDCFLLDSVTFPEMLSLVTECGQCDADGGAITLTEAQQLVKKGYVEILAEGTVEPKTSDKTQCDEESSDPPTILIPGSTLNDLWRDSECIDDIYELEPLLQGRQYYVEVDTTVSPVSVVRLAQLNAVMLDNELDDDVILHENNYTDELNSNGTYPLSDCNAADDSEKCYAYAEAETTDGTGATADGANDMNRCFYTNMISGDLVINKFGAAATFGPTLADIGDERNGGLQDTADDINENLDDGLAQIEVASEFYVDPNITTKQYVESHYFYAPTPGHYDLQTAFAFVFPLKHFIGEAETITAIEIYDNAENSETIQIGKFISPGLPTPGTFAAEAEIFYLAAPYNEGWIRYEVSATNATTGCNDETGDLDCEILGQDVDYSTVSTPTEDYVPAYVGAVFTTGANHIGASPFNYSNQEFIPQDPENVP